MTMYLSMARTLRHSLANVRKVFERLREFKVAVNPKKTKLELAEVEYVGHVVSAEGTSFTEEKRLKVLKFLYPKLKRTFGSSLDSPATSVIMHRP